MNPFTKIKHCMYILFGLLVCGLNMYKINPPLKLSIVGLDLG
jgi:hypothetical protein